MFSLIRKLSLCVGFVVAIAIFATEGWTQEAPQDVTASILPGDLPTALPDETAAPAVVVWCLVTDVGLQKIFYAPLHRVRSASSREIGRLSARFVRSVNAQQQADLAIGRHACVGSPTTLAASGALNRMMAPLLGQGYVAVPIGVY